MAVNLNSEFHASSVGEFPSPDPERPYVYPGTLVLINKFGIRNLEVFNRVEAAVAGLREEMFRLHPVAGNFDLDHLCSIHRYLFQDIFPWAGELRCVDITKMSGNKEPHMFKAAEIIPRSGEVVASLHAEKCLCGLGREQFIERGAFYYIGFNELHPFREGNGRTLRLFFQQLASAAGYCMDFSGTTKSALWEASRAGRDGDLAPLATIFRQITV